MQVDRRNAVRLCPGTSAGQRSLGVASTSSANRSCPSFNAATAHALNSIWRVAKANGQRQHSAHGPPPWPRDGTAHPAEYRRDDRSEFDPSTGRKIELISIKSEIWMRQTSSLRSTGVSPRRRGRGRRPPRVRAPNRAGSPLSEACRGPAFGRSRRGQSRSPTLASESASGPSLEGGSQDYEA